MASTLENKILEVTGEKKQKTKEDRQKYLQRILTAVSGTSDDHWKALGKEGQNWQRENADLINSSPNAPLPDFAQDLEDIVYLIVDDTDEDPQINETKGKRNGGLRHVRSAFIKNPKLTLSELVEDALNSGFVVSKTSANTTISCVKSTIGVLIDLGHLDKNFLKHE